MTIAQLSEKIKNMPFSSLNDVIYDFLFESIITNQMLPGTLLNENQLSAELIVSRTPVHSAIDRLVKDGLVLREKNRCAQVAPLSMEEYSQISGFRSAVEGAAAYAAAKLICQEELDELNRILIDMHRREKSQVPYPENDTLFHEIIINASRNAFFREAYQLYRGKLLRYRWYIHEYVHFRAEDFLNRERVHTAIYHALRLRLSDSAQKEAALDASYMGYTVFRF